MKIERFEDIEAWRLYRSVAAWPETCEKSAQDVLKTVNCEPRTVNGY